MKRPTIFGFHVNGLDVSDPIALLIAALTQTEHIMSEFNVKAIHFINLEATTAVRVQTGKQMYMRKWRALVDQVFAATGGASYELCSETSEKVKALFRERERTNPASVVMFQVKLNTNF